MNSPSRINFRLLRWRLPLSYAGIALLAALVLGAGMLAVLRSYYTEREREYLLLTAQTIRAALVSMTASGADATELSNQLAALAYTSQTRVRLENFAGETIFDSGIPILPRIQAFQAEVPAPPVGIEPSADTPAGSGDVIFRGDPAIPLSEPGAAGGIFSFTFPVSPTRGITGTVRTFTLLPDPVTVYGFDFSQGPEISTERSKVEVSLPLFARAERQLGSITVSSGPAYGREIVASVARAWAVAGALAVLLAAAAGWATGRRMIAPLDVLTNATQRMATGDLSARAEAATGDEFEILGRAFDQMGERIQATVETLRQFASDAAHELQTPLTALRTNLDLAASATSADSRQEALQQAQEQVDRLNSLSQGLLDLARLEANSVASQPEAVEIVALASELSERYAAQADQRGVEFSLQLPTTPVYVPGHPALLQRLLSNLLENALKFTPPGGRITLGGELLPEGLRLWVEDTGIGIPPEDLPQLFSRFHRGRNAAAYPGSGLGLAIARAIAEAHHGRLSAENLPSGGARFTFYLPGEAIGRGK